MSKAGEWYRMRYVFLTVGFLEGDGYLTEWPPKVKPAPKSVVLTFSRTSADS